MADILKISDATALALHSLVYLARAPTERPTTILIAKEFNVSRHHLSKVHQRLTRAGILNSQRGPAGGVQLAKDPAKIKLAEIYEVMQGSMLSTPCLFGKDACHRADCVLGNLLPGLTQQVLDYFEKTTLAQLATEQNKGTNS